MKRFSSILTSVLLAISASAQDPVTGIVVDDAGNGIYGISINSNSTISTTSSKEGEFSFVMPADSASIIVKFSHTDYYPKHLKIYKGEKDIVIVLNSYNETLSEAVVRSNKYGRFSNYEAQITRMNSFEIKTTPNALGDIIGGMKVLPGVQSNDNDGRLILLGGDTDESAIYIDGLINFNPYTMMQKNVSVRNRLSPDLFGGVSLQSTGFSASYGNAMSGVMHLDSYNADQMISKADLNINTTGIEGTIIHSKNKFACRLNASYMNLTPYYKIFKTDYNLIKPYNNITLNLFMANQVKKRSAVKTSLSYNQASSDFSYDNIESITIRNNNKENNFSGSVTCDIYINDEWNLYLGANIAYYNFSTTDAQIKTDSVYYRKIDSHSKIELTYHKGAVTNTIGVENIYSSFDEDYYYDGKYKLNYQNCLISAYDVLSVYINDRLNLNCGLRYEFATYINKRNLAPRVYISYKLNNYNILSLSGGIYYQMPKQQISGYTDDLQFRSARTLTLTYSYVKNSSKFQADLYFKKYRDLTTYDYDRFYLYNFNSDGYGTVFGANVFWKRTISNFEYWTSYSYIDAKIKSDLHKSAVMPEYLSHHRINVTCKYWIKGIRSMIGASFFIDDGATFYKESNTEISVKSPIRSRTDLSWSYLPTSNIIIHLSCQNILGRRNVYGYEYSSFDSSNARPIVTPERRFIYLGVFFTFTKNNNINQLNSL